MQLNFKKSYALLFAPMALGLAVAMPGRASAQVFVTPNGSTTGGGSVNAEADFTLSNGKIMLVLKNLLQNPTADSQLLNGVSFDVTGASSSGSLITTNSGNISSISGGGAYTAGTADALTRWKATEAGTNIGLTALGGGTPNRLIIGPDSKGNIDPNLGGLYSNANPSITGVHNPSVLGSASFTINVAGVNSLSSLSNVVFDFGTASGSNIVNASAQTNVPEPGVNAMIVGMGIGGLGMYARRRRARQSFNTNS